MLKSDISEGVKYLFFTYVHYRCQAKSKFYLSVTINIICQLGLMEFPDTRSGILRISMKVNFG